MLERDQMATEQQIHAALQATGNTAKLPAVAESLNYLMSECDNLAEGLLQMEAIIDRITGTSQPPMETVMPDNVSGLLGDVQAITTRVRVATTLIRDHNARLAELF